MGKLKFALLWCLLASIFPMICEASAPAGFAEAYQARRQGKAAPVSRVTPASVPMRETADEYTDIHGLMLWSYDWLSMQPWEYPYGVYRFTESELKAELEYNVVPDAITAALVDGDYYVVSRELDGGQNVVDIRITRYDATTGVRKNELVIDEPKYSKLPLIITHDQSAGRTYALTYTADNQSHLLATIDLETGAMTAVGVIGGVDDSATFLTLTACGDGKIFAIATDGNLYSINSATGRATVVGATGVMPRYLQSAAYDSKTGSLWWAASLADDSAALYKVSTETGQATKYGDFAAAEEFVGLYVDDIDLDPAAPERSGDLEFLPSGEGANSGQLIGMLPELTVGGETLTGTLNVSVAVDGETVETFVDEPGATFAIDLTLETGMHSITVVASTAETEGVPATISLWVGPDVPAAVSNVLLIEENGLAYLSWNPSRAGQHGGYCPTENIRYRVTRADGTVAAEDLTATEFSEDFPEIIAEYSYSVTPYVPGVGDGIAQTSNRVLAGQYFELPQLFDFNNSADFDRYFTVIDENDDTYTWYYNYTWDAKVGVAQYSTNWMGVKADDYLVFPGIKFDSGTRYSLTFNHSKDNYNHERVAIRIGKGKKVEDLNVVLAQYEDIYVLDGSCRDVRFSLDEAGVYYIAFHIISDGAQGNFYIDDVEVKEVGPDSAPAAMELSAETLRQDNRDCVTLKINTPTTTLAGGALTSLTKIEVYRGENSEPVHTFSAPAIGSTLEWTDTNPGSGPVKYRVVGVNEHGYGEFAETEIYVGGVVPPVEYTFESDEELKYFTILDNNNDGTTWTRADGAMICSYNMFEDADDWLITPTLSLDSERVYQLIATLQTNASNAENLAITMGMSADPAEHEVLLDMPGMLLPEAKDIKLWIRPEESGSYNIGFHDYSLKNQMRIYLLNLKVEDVASANAPAEVSDLEGSGDAGGLLRTTLTFVAPTLSYRGETLAALDAIEIYRGTAADPVEILTDVTPGMAITWTDENAVQGLNAYRICGVNSEGRGLMSEIEVYAGHDAPAAVRALAAKGDATNANALLSWEAPVAGTHGGYVEASSLTYNIYSGTSIYSLSPLATGVKTTSYTDKRNNTGRQKAYTYVVEACSDAGVGGRDTVVVALGKLHAYPFAETFSNYFSDEWINTILTNYNASWIVTNEQDGVTSADSGSGFLMFRKWADDENVALGVLESPKISMEASSNPYLALSFYHNPAADARKAIRVGYRVNDGDFVELACLKPNAAEEGWADYSWHVEAGATDFVSVVLRAESYDKDTYMFVDKISLDDRLVHNLAVKSLAGPAEIGVDGATLTVEITNKGLVESGDFDVVLICNDEEVETISKTALAPGGDLTVPFNIGAPAASEAGSQRIYCARIDYAQDEREIDNISDELVATILTSPYPGVTALTARAEDGKVVLEWETPVQAWCPALTDSFENYAPFAIENLGNWVLYDGDGQRTVGIRYGLTFDNWYAPKAWQVWDPTRAGLLGEDVAARDGHMCLMSMQSDGTIPGMDDSFAAKNDDWLISEKVEGGSDVTFWLKQPVNTYGGNEAVEVLYSASSQSPEDFELLRTIELDNKAVWNFYRVSLPADACYFAIRHHQSFFGIWLDDITYSPTRNSTEISIENYNIYRDKELIGTAATTAFTDAAPLEGTHAYAVAPKFDVGEGRLSNEVEIDVNQSGLDGVASDSKVRIYARNGEICVATDTACDVQIFTPAGHMVAESTVDGFASFAVVKGIYIVKAGTTVSKIMID